MIACKELFASLGDLHKFKWEYAGGKWRKYKICTKRRTSDEVATEKNQKYVMKLQYSKSQKYVTE